MTEPIYILEARHLVKTYLTVTAVGDVSFGIRAGQALAEPHVRPMEIGDGRRPRASVCVDPEGYATDDALAERVGHGIAFVSSLSAKDAMGRKAR